MYFDIQKAEKVRRFISNLCFTAGPWAGQKFELLEWQWERVIKPLFGTLKHEGGPRQYRYCYVEIPKKNGKTELAAAIALYMLCADGERSPEVYSAASDREQAGLVYKPATYMVRENNTLAKNLKCLDARKRIINSRNSGFYQVLSSEVYTKHGLNPSCVIIDELHGHPNDELYRVLTSGTHYAREQQIVLILTTAGIYDVETVWWRTREKARQIEAGIVEDPSFLPVLYIAYPEKDSPDDEELWKRVNPSLGQIFTLDKIREEYQTAKQNPIEWADFLRFRLNIPIKHLVRWMPMDKWDQCSGEIPDLDGRMCYGGIDLSSKLDLSVFVLVFPPAAEGEKWVIFPRFYCPESTILERSRSDRVRYDIWQKQGFITATPGETIDYAFIEKDILAAVDKYDVRSIGYDPWGATELATRLYNDNGVQMVEIRQGAKSMSEPSKDILVKIINGMVNHGGHPVLRWCADNVVMVPDSNENIKPVKDKATDRIDGFVALVNAWAMAILNPEPVSVYEHRGGGLMTL